MLPHENAIVSRTERQNFPSGTVMPAPTARKLPAGNGIFRGRHTTNPVISPGVRYLGPPVRANRLAFAPWPLAHTRVPACEAPSALRRGTIPPINRDGQTPPFTGHDYRTGGEEHSVGRSRRPRLGRARRWWAYPWARSQQAPPRRRGGQTFLSGVSPQRADATPEGRPPPCGRTRRGASSPRLLAPPVVVAEEALAEAAPRARLEPHAPSPLARRRAQRDQPFSPADGSSRS